MRLIITMSKLVNVCTSNDNLNTVKRGLIKTTVLAGNGIFELAESWVGESIKSVFEYPIPIYPNLEESVTISNKENRPTIPVEALLYTMKWYRDITKSTGNEAQVNFYLGNRDTEITINDEIVKVSNIRGVEFWGDNIFSYTPKQANCVAETQAVDPIYNILNQQVGMYVETHSHNNMRAFASGTDLENSKSDGIQLVFGRLNTNEIQMYSWATVRGLIKQGLIPEELSQYVDMPKSEFRDSKIIFDKDLSKLLDEQPFNQEVFDSWNNQIVK